MGGVELLRPSGLVLLAGLVPLILVYVLKIRRPRVRVASTWLWRSAERDLLAKHPFRRLQREVSLILEALAVVALAVALARPAMRGHRIVGEHVAIVVDTSASMGTLRPSDGRTRLAAAQAAARDVVAGLSPGADAIVIEAAREARLVTGAERDARRLREAIGSLAVREVEGDLAGAVALAADRVRERGGRGKVIVVTDGALARARDEVLAAEGVSIDVLTVGEPADNAAIVRVDVRAGVDPATRREETQVFARVRNYGEHARDLFVTVALEGARAGEPLASRRVLVAPHDAAAIVLTFEPRAEMRGRGLVIALSPGDALAQDDRAFGRVPAAPKTPVTLASSTSRSWIARALEADPDVDLQRLSLEQLATVNVDPDALVIVEGACPATLPGHDALLVAPPPGVCADVDVSPKIDAPQITSWDNGDARLRFLTLDGVHVREATPLRARGASSALVRAGEHTLMADASLPGRSVTVLGFDVGESDWPLKASFVLFVRNVVEQARAHRADGAAGVAHTGEPLRLTVPSDVTSLVVEGPDAIVRTLTVQGGIAAVPGVERAGLYRVRWSSPRAGAALVAANLTSEPESDVTPRAVTVASAQDGAAAVVKAAPETHVEWGKWLALLAAIAIGLDVLWLARGRPAAGRKASVVGAAVAAVPLAYAALGYLGVVRETYLRFAHPALLVLSVLAAPLVVREVRRLAARLAPLRRRLVTALTLTAFFAALVAVAEPEVGRPLDGVTAILAVDRSRSVDLVPGADVRVAAEMKLAERSMRDDDRIGAVVFGADATMEDPPRPRSALPPPQRASIGRDGTDVEAAVRRALSELPADTVGRVVLLSDGVQTRGDALAAAAAALAANVPVDAVVLEQKVSADVRVAAVRATARADQHEAIDLRVVTQSAVPTDVAIRVRRDGELVREAKAHISAGEDVLRLRETATAPGLHRYDVELTALDPRTDSSPDDNAGAVFVHVRGPSLALVLEGDPGKGAPLARALTASGFLTEERSTSGVPADVGELAGFDLVVLSDIRASDLTGSQIDALASYTRDVGGGLLLMGGDRAMGPGGYARTPLEAISPVGFDLKQEKRRASLAEVIAIDYSGSMGATVGGQTKLALANEAAARSASLLGPGDQLGVEHVDDKVSWTVRIAKVSDEASIAAKIRGVGVGSGGIYTDLALREAYAALRQSEAANLKHVLLFADGDDAEQIAGCRAQVVAALQSGITTSVISLGRGHDTPELEVLAKLGSGRFYLIDDATKLPAVFSQETILAAKSAISEEPFRASAGAPSPATRGIDLASAPPLGGYVVTVPKPRASVALSGPEGDPILATWGVGVGRAAAFTSDFKDRWGAGWLAWPDGAKLFGQLARDTARRAEDPRVRFETDTRGGELHVRADIVGDDGRAQSFRRLTAHVGGPDGFSRDVPLEATGAGRYAATVPLSRPGTYVTTARDELSGEAVATAGAVLLGGEELRPTGSDRVLLARIAAITGGRLRDTLAGLFDDRAARRFAYSALGPPLVLFTAVALLAAVGARRIGVPELAFRWAEAHRARVRTRAEAREGRRRELALAEELRTRDRQRAHESLLAKKQRGRGEVTLPAAPDAPPPSATPPHAAPAHAPSADAPQPNAPPAAERVLSAAEVIAKRRRERR